MTAEQVSAADASREDFFGNGDVGRVDVLRADVGADVLGMESIQLM